MAGPFNATNKHSFLLVKEFHEKFGHPIALAPQIPGFELRKLRARLIIEELEEFMDASGLLSAGIYELFHRLTAELRYLPDTVVTAGVDIVEAADALGDLDYVIQGANLVWGFQAQVIINEIHRSNMTKLGADGKPVKRGDGKILKGPNYEPPRIKEIIEMYQYLYRTTTEYSGPPEVEQSARPEDHPNSAHP